MIAPTAIPQIPVDLASLPSGATAPTGFHEVYLMYTILNTIQPMLGDQWLATYPPDLSSLLSAFITTQVPEYEQGFAAAVQTAATTINDTINLGEGNPLPAIVTALDATGNLPSLVAPYAGTLAQYLSVENTASGGSTSTVLYPAGSTVTSVTTTYAAPNGTGGLSTEDQENANGTSQITTYNSTGYIEKTYSATGVLTGGNIDDGASTSLDFSGGGNWGQAYTILGNPGTDTYISITIGTSLQWVINEDDSGTPPLPGLTIGFRSTPTSPISEESTIALPQVTGIYNGPINSPISAPGLLFQTSFSLNANNTETVVYGFEAPAPTIVATAPPVVSGVTPDPVEKGQTTVIGTVTPGVAGDVLTLTETAGIGTLSLGAVQANGTQQVIYTAPSSVPASTKDAVSYQVKDQQNGTSVSGSASVQLDAGPSVASLPFLPGAPNVAVTVASAMPGLATDTLSLVVTQAPQSGTLALHGTSVQFTPTTSSTLLKPVTFTFDLKDQLGGTTPVQTVIVGGDLANNVTGSVSGNTDIGLGNGLNKITLAGSGNVVDAGNGANGVSGGVSNNNVILGNGLDSVSLSGGDHTITLGNGADSVSVGDSGNKITLGNGLDVVHGGTGDTINLAKTALTIYGTDEMLFIGAGSAAVSDFSTGLDLKIGPTAGVDILAHFASDPSGVVDLIGGIGGFKTAAAVLSALKSDGHGGTLLSFGSGSSLDFTGVASSQLHASNFQIG